MLALLAFRPETAGAIDLLTEVVLRGPSPLSRGERELIATFVSKRNECQFCTAAHMAIAGEQLPGGVQAVQSACETFPNAPVSEKLSALLAIAAQVQVSGRAVTSETVAHAKSLGASDVEIHDTVLIAATFCMFNRYVDGLGALLPEAPEAYFDAMAKRITKNGYNAGA